MLASRSRPSSHGEGARLKPPRLRIRRPKSASSGTIAVGETLWFWAWSGVVIAEGGIIERQRQAVDRELPGHRHQRHQRSGDPDAVAHEVLGGGTGVAGGGDLV